MNLNPFRRRWAVVAYSGTPHSDDLTRLPQYVRTFITKRAAIGYAVAMRGLSDEVNGMLVAQGLRPLTVYDVVPADHPDVAGGRQWPEWQGA